MNRTYHPHGILGDPTAMITPAAETSMNALDVESTAIVPIVPIARLVAAAENVARVETVM